MHLNQLKVIVTGGAQGMGAHFARRLSENGAQVTVGDVNEEALESLPNSVHRRRLDVTNESEVKRFVSFAEESMSGLNVLVNNAGIIRDGLLVKRDKVTQQAVGLATEQLTQVLAVNLLGAIVMTREVVASLVNRGEKPGVIVNMSSIARHGNRGQSNYVAAKAALAANTVTWALEFAPFGIRVGAIAPGMIATPMTQGMNQKALEAILTKIPVGRVGQPEDIWLALRFILECDFFNGRTIDVDGGMSF